MRGCLSWLRTMSRNTVPRLYPWMTTTSSTSVGGHQAVDIHLHHGGSGFGNFHRSAFFLVFD